MTSVSCDVLVLGCGGFGSSAMYHLSRRGLKVIGIDRFHPPHTQGSSHGETRIIRKAYFEHPNYVPLLHRAWVLWEELADESQERLIEQRDLLMSGPPGSEIVEGARRSGSLHQLPLKNLTSADARKRYPMFHFPEDHSIVVESTAGFLWSERCVATHLEQAASMGAVLMTNETVVSISGSADRLTVRTDRATYSAGAGVVTCGAWSGQLLPDYLPHIKVLRKTLCWYPVESGEWVKPERAPLFLLDVPGGQFYGLSSVDGQTIKVGMHTGGETVQDPSLMSRVATDEDQNPLNQFVRSHLAGIHPQAARATVCMYSMSPDGHFLFDRRNDLPLVIGAGFSGHGFKFTSVLGGVAADLIEYGRSRQEIDFLSASRLGL